MVRIEYRCADGTPFPVDFENEEQAAKTWMWDPAHNPAPQSPMAVALGVLGRPGGDRAYAEVELPLAGPFFGPGLQASGFAYGSASGFDEELVAKLREPVGKLIVTYGGSSGTWETYSRPRTMEACAFLQGAGSDVPLADLADRERYGLMETMIPMMIAGNDTNLLAAVVQPVFGEQSQFIALELTQGWPNATVEADQALWELGRLVLATPAVSAALRAEDPRPAMASLRGDGAATEFFTRLDAFMETYGFRAEVWSIDSPTWSELGNGFWAQLRQMSRGDLVPPIDALAKGAARRDALVAEIEAGLADDADALAKFRRRFERIAGYVQVREDRALWQLISSGSLRHAVLRRGRLLVDAGRLDSADDILFLVPDEVEGDAVGATDLRPLVAERRAAHDWARRLTPPSPIGGETPTEAPPAAAPVDGVLQGVAAARGLTSGPARVITDLCDADRVEPGDVLVCVMTSPPWTPLFSIASAVVCDSGELMSHPAIAAREYGIPCVLSVKGATANIPDGALVTVDGTKGTVTIAD